MSEVINQEQKQTKQPADPKKKAFISRLITIIGSCVGIVVLILFGVFVTQESAKVYFYGKNVNIEAINVNKDTHKIEVPKDPTRHGYDFMGWYLDKEFSGEKVDLTTHLFEKEKKEFDDDRPERKNRDKFGDRSYKPEGKKERKKESRKDSRKDSKKDRRDRKDSGRRGRNRSR